VRDWVKMMIVNAERLRMEVKEICRRRDRQCAGYRIIRIRSACMWCPQPAVRFVSGKAYGVNTITARTASVGPLTEGAAAATAANQLTAGRQARHCRARGLFLTKSGAESRLTWGNEVSRKPPPVDLFNSAAKPERCSKRLSGPYNIHYTLYEINKFSVRYINRGHK